MRLLNAAAGLAVAALAAPAAADAQQPPRQIVSAAFSTTQPGAAAGARVDIQIRNPQDPNAKPHALRRMVIAYPESSLFDFTVPETCEASDAQLQTQGAAACPPGSVVARGRLDTDTGSPGGFPRYVENDLTTFNGGDGELVTLAESKGSPQTRVVGRSRIRGSTLTTDISPVPGNPPPDPFTAYRRLTLAGSPMTKAGSAYLTTPPTCPPSGAWTFTMTLTYRDGVEQTATARTPCRRAGEPAFAAPGPEPPPGNEDDPPFAEPRATRPPRVRVSGVPRRCVRGSFVLRVRATAEARLRHVVVELDGRRIRVARRGTFRVRVRVARLARGRHRLDVTARDRAGDLGAATARFRRC